MQLSTQLTGRRCSGPGRIWPVPGLWLVLQPSFTEEIIAVNLMTMPLGICLVNSRKIHQNKNINTKGDKVKSYLIRLWLCVSESIKDKWIKQRYRALPKQQHIRWTMFCLLLVCILLIQNVLHSWSALSIWAIPHLHTTYKW